MLTSCRLSVPLGLLCLTMLGCEHSVPLKPIYIRSNFDPTREIRFNVHLDSLPYFIIKPQKSTYTWGSEDLGTSRQIEATVRNNSPKTYYANLGDGFNSSIDQTMLFVAEGSGGSIERYNSDSTWTMMPRGVLTEGTRFIALRPGQSYRLLAPLHNWRGDETGQFRIKVEYYDRIDPQGASRHVDYSRVFRIR